MTEKRFRVTISNTNTVCFIDFVDNKQLMSITFKNKSDAVDCKNALMYQCDLLNELYEEKKSMENEIDFCHQIIQTFVDQKGVDDFWDLINKCDEDILKDNGWLIANEGVIDYD